MLGAEEIACASTIDSLHVQAHKVAEERGLLAE